VSSGAAELVGGGSEGLRGAVELARGGREVRFVEPALRAGAPFVTESFLTPFRFNLGQSLVLRSAVPDFELLEPDPLMAVGSATLERAPVALEPGATAVATLETNGVGNPALRTTLLALGLVLGIDPVAPGSGASLADLAARLDDLVVVAGGSGLVSAALCDELVAAGGQLVEGAGPPVVPEPFQGLGMCRLFVGLRRPRPNERAFIEAHGFEDEESLGSALDRLRMGDTTRAIGFVVDNTHLDPHGVLDERLGSFVWQGPLPAGTAIARSAYTASVLELLDLDRREVVFSLLWLPEETGEPLGGAPWPWTAPSPALV
jgi:hypothetical protein